MHGCGVQVAFGAITLSQRVIARQRIIRVVQQRLELVNGLVPAPLLLIEPTQKVTGIGSIKTAFENLFTEVNRIVETPLGLKSLRLSQRPSDLSGRNPFTGALSHPSTGHAIPSKRRSWLGRPVQIPR